MTGELGVLLLGLAPEHGLPAQAVAIGKVFGFPVTNSMMVSWVVAPLAQLHVKRHRRQ